VLAQCPGSHSCAAVCRAAGGVDDRQHDEYVTGRPLEQDEDSIMRAVPHDDDGLIALFCLVACKRGL
jgi:hypothetical protein